MLALASVLKPLAKAGLAHYLLVWIPAVIGASWIRGYKSQKTSHKPFQTGYFLIIRTMMVLAPLPGTRAALMLSL
eukprot:391892-Pelagomonas_calceolata.AAC.1